MENVYTNRYKSYCRSLSNLAFGIGADPDEPLILPGVVQCFSLSFDLAWKVMKDVLTKRLGILDFKAGSPREVLNMAFSNGLISSEVWLSMLRTRNTLVHDYDGKIAHEKFSQIMNEYYPIMCQFKETIEPYCRESENIDHFK